MENSSERTRWILSALMVVPVLALMGTHIVAITVGCLWMIVLTVIMFISLEVHGENKELKKKIEDYENGKA